MGFRKLLTRRFAFQCTDNSDAQRCNQRHKLTMVIKVLKISEGAEIKGQRTGGSKGDIRCWFTSIFSFMQRETEEARETEREREIVNGRAGFSLHVFTTTFHQDFFTSLAHQKTQLQMLIRMLACLFVASVGSIKNTLTLGRCNPAERRETVMCMSMH